VKEVYNSENRGGSKLKTLALAGTFMVMACLPVLAQAGEKVVPRTDKLTAELVGTVRDTFAESPCGPQEALVVLEVNGRLPYPMPAGVVCAGALVPQCLAFKAGQRIHVQGVLVSVPDPSTPGFNKCDPGTWTQFTPTFAFAVTKILR
jgi:hypothetical protein